MEEIKRGIRLFSIKDDKFKTYSIAVFIHRPLNRDEVTKNALLPYVLKRGSKNYPNSQIISQALTELYGASLNSGVVKRGEDQVISFYMEAVSERFLPSKCMNGVLDLLFDVLLNPLVNNNAFDEDTIKQEKNNLNDLILSAINDKRNYAIERCYEEMCKDEAFGLPELGFVEDLNGISGQSLYEHYKKIISESNIDVFIAGNFEQSNIKQRLDVLNERSQGYPKTEFISEAKPTWYTDEKMNITQGKLSIGFRTGIAPNSEDYYALMVYNSVFGSGAHSKLFNNVREKLSLAYYAQSRIERLKGLMIVASGIEFVNYQKAIDEIFAQEKEMHSNITDEEMNSAILSLVNALRSYKDSTKNQIDYYLGQALAGTNTSIDEVIEKISSVKKDDVFRVAKSISAETVYFLKGVE